MLRIPRTQDISWFLDLAEKGQLDLDPPYQRRSVWSTMEKRFFIDTIMNNYPAPPIFLHKSLDDNGRATYHVVDGKQRLTTILEFHRNEIRLPDDFKDKSLSKKFWSDLDRESRETFWNYTLIVEMISDVSEPSVRDIFERFNRNSRKLTSQELRHAKYDGWFISTVEDEAKKSEWAKFGLSSASRVKRMADVQFISELYAVVIRQKIEGFDQDKIDELYAEFEDIEELAAFDEVRFASEIDRVRSYLMKLLIINDEFVKDFRIQTHFYTLWSIIALEEDRLLHEREVARRYSEFMDMVRQDEDETNVDSAVKEYRDNMRGAVTDLSRREARYNALSSVILSEADD